MEKGIKQLCVQYMFTCETQDVSEVYQTTQNASIPLPDGERLGEEKTIKQFLMPVQRLNNLISSFLKHCKGLRS